MGAYCLRDGMSSLWRMHVECIYIYIYIYERERESVCVSVYVRVFIYGCVTYGDTSLLFDSDCGVLLPLVCAPLFSFHVNVC
jgi:hypothetical protein